jgi:dihydroceramide fatty acyl 2-hydroxylase
MKETNMSDPTQGGPGKPTEGMSKADQLSASPKLFDNETLEKYSRTDWKFPLVYLPFAFLFLILGAKDLPGVVVLMGFAFGYLAWTLCEYSFHRWLFHADFKGKSGERIHHLLHGVHHEHPNDPLRLVMPPLMSVPLMLFASIVIFVIIAAPGSYVVLAGFLCGYVLYDQIHYHVHHREPRTKIEQTLRRLHLLHHFRDPTKGFGVSAPFWDGVFSTAFEEKDKTTSEKPL